ncbi:MAG: sigma-70 family RNA polymerase sigma factor [Actinomycetota bacterium]|nr:sigma-70 family RNA polymerase sigma factor [Actinomycetota bacterium]
MDTTTTAVTIRSQDPDYLSTHYGLAVTLARRYSQRGSWSESSEDLVQVALLGLVRAIERFDPERGVPFSAYATSTIVGELKHYQRDRSWAVRPPRRIQNLYLRSQEAITDLTQELGRPPTPAEIGDRVDASAADVEEALEAASLRRPTSLDASPAGDDRPLASRLQDDDSGLSAVEERLAVRSLLTRLPERERRMVSLRYLDGLTQTEIADRMRLSQAHVQRMLVRSLHQLRVLARAS